MEIRHLTDRLWLYGPGGWDGAWRLRASDEYGRRTLLLRLSGKRAIVCAYLTCRCDDCDDVRRGTATAEAETQQVMAFYGVDRDAAYEMPGDAWNKALAASADG